uniref:Uncharacterized protein n=1 Tax=Arabidopsis halleri subsp. halleri TaxID=81971 RepID=I0J3I9_ARAHH|nr:unknown [Arabidopsis halleri subsp. halleri]
MSQRSGAEKGTKIVAKDEMHSESPFDVETRRSRATRVNSGIQSLLTLRSSPSTDFSATCLEMLEVAIGIMETVATEGEDGDVDDGDEDEEDVSILRDGG